VIGFLSSSKNAIFFANKSLKHFISPKKTKSMKKVALILSIVALCSFTIGYVFNDSTMVWVCSSSNVYHRLPSCSELKKCSKPTRTSLTAAKEKGMTPCSICFDKKEKQNPKATESVNKSKSTKVDKTANNSNTGKGKQSTKAKKAKPEKKATKQTKVDKTTNMDEESETTIEDQSNSNEDQDQDE